MVEPPQPCSQESLTMPADGQTTELVEVSTAIRERAALIPVSTHGLAPRNLAELMDFGQLMAKAGPMVGKAFRGAPGSCVAIAMQAMRWNMDPFAVSQKAYVTQDKYGNEQIGYEAQLINAVVLSNAPMMRRPQYAFTGSGNRRRCKVTIWLRGESEALEYETPEIVPEGRSPLWKNDLDQQLSYFAIRSWARRHMPELLMGVYAVDELQDAGVIGEAHIVGEYDQRPAGERVGGVIGGKPARDAFDDLALRMSESEDAAALEEVWSEAESANLSSNRMFALSEHYEACKEAHENGKPTPAAPTFSEPPPPSPFEALKEAGAKVSDVESYKAWSAQLKADLPRCTDEERAELKALHAPIAAKFLPPKESAGAGGRTDKDAGHAAAESSGADPGGEAPPASLSAFERLKQACLDCLQSKAKRRALADWRKEVDACADLTTAERADLDKIEANVREGLTK